MIVFKNIIKRYGELEALSQITFHLQRGEMAFLTGHSGAGKSTLLKLISFIERPTQGQMILNGENVTTIDKKRIPYVRRTIGVAFQEPKLLQDRNVFSNVALPLEVASYHPHEMARRVRIALDRVGLLNKEKSLPRELSSGEQQRVGIARAIVHKPLLLLADEPTGNLDPKLSMQIMSLFEQFNQMGITVLVASHDLGLIAAMRYRILTLREGKLV